jgi:NADPH:quinone reductase-like Zn-dependent oxidoreductase
LLPLSIKSIVSNKANDFVHNSAEYTVCPEHTAWQLADTTSFEDAATLPLAGTTAAIGLFRRLRLSEPPLDGSVGNAEGVVVLNGAATSVGVFIIQLVKKAGYKVVGVAGDSEELAKSLGADYVVNYRNKSPQELGKAIKEAVASTGQKIVGVFDAFSSKSSVEMIAYEVLQPEGGRITTLNPHYDNGEGLSVSNVEIDRTYVSLICALPLCVSLAC